MNLLKQLWNWVVKKTSTAPQLAAVEEEPTPVEVEETPDVGEMFGYICREAGVRNRDLISTDAIALFVEWYDEAPTEESIRAAIPSFKKAYPKVNAKLAGKI